MIGISGSLIWSKILMKLIFNPVANFGKIWRVQLAKSTHHLHVGIPGIFSDLLRSVQLLKRERGAESNLKVPYLFIPSKTVSLVPELAMEDLPLGRTATLVAAFAVKNLPSGTTVLRCATV